MANRRIWVRLDVNKWNWVKKNDLKSYKAIIQLCKRQGIIIKSSYTGNKLDGQYFQSSKGKLSKNQIRLLWIPVYRQLSTIKNAIEFPVPPKLLHVENLRSSKWSSTQVNHDILCLVIPPISISELSFVLKFHTILYSFISISNISNFTLHIR